MYNVVNDGGLVGAHVGIDERNIDGLIVGSIDGPNVGRHDGRFEGMFEVEIVGR